MLSNGGEGDYRLECSADVASNTPLMSKRITTFEVPSCSEQSCIDPAQICYVISSFRSLPPK